MSALFPPPQTRTIGYANVNGQRVPVVVESAWFQYFAQGLYDRTGGALGTSTSDLAASAFEDAGIEELKARLYQLEDEIGVLPPVVQLPAEASGGVNSVAVLVDFGALFTDKAQTVVSGQSWVDAASEIVCQVLTPASTDPDEMRLLDMRVVISDIVAGDGFTVTVYSETEARGVYTVACIGV